MYSVNGRRSVIPKTASAVPTRQDQNNRVLGGGLRKSKSPSTRRQKERLIILNCARSCVLDRQLLTKDPSLFAFCLIRNVF